MVGTKNRTALVTADGAIPNIKDETAAKVAIYRDGEVYVVENGEHDEFVKGAFAYAKRLGIPLQQPFKQISVSDMVQLYRDAGKSLQSGVTSGGGNVNGESVMIAKFGELCQSAIQLGASDLHLAYKGDRVFSRFRINGSLTPFNLKMPHTEVIDFMRSVFTNATQKNGNYSEAGYNECSHFQDLVPGLRLVRGQFSPTGFNSRKGVLRFHMSDVPLEYEALGISPEHQAVLEEMEDFPRGVMIITGPTGSGKTTLLRAFMHRTIRKYPGESFYGIEDPEEMHLEGLESLPVFTTEGSKKGETAQEGYERAVAAMLRSDPDRALVGEMRYWQTARAVFGAVDTGHPIYSTIHADDWCMAIPRLLELKVDRGPLTNPKTVRCIGGMRLVRELCPHCSQEVKPNDLKEYGGSLAQNLMSFEGTLRVKGTPCNKKLADGLQCRDGFVGRTAVLELAKPKAAELRELVDGSVAMARGMWLRGGGQSMLMHAESKMMQGRLDPRDVARFIGMPGDDSRFLAEFIEGNDARPFNEYAARVPREFAA